MARSSRAGRRSVAGGENVREPRPAPAIGLMVVRGMRRRLTYGVIVRYYHLKYLKVHFRHEVRMTRTRIALCAALLASLALAQQTLTNESVVKLAKAGMGDDLIINMVNTQLSSFSLTTDDVIALKTGGVSDKVISAMVARSTGAVPAALTTSASAAGPLHEVGVYYKKGDAWTDMEPEVVTFKTGGVLKSIATDGIIKGDVNGHIKGAHGKADVKTPVEILIYVPEGVAATEYQLLHLHEEKDAREFRTMTGGVFHKSGGATRDAIEFDAKKTAPRTFTFTLSNLKTGEYGLLPPSSGDATGSTGRLGKLYTFHVIE
jgi:hypothetical protein